MGAALDTVANAVERDALRSQKCQAAFCRLKEFGAETKVESRARYDLYTYWLPRIAKAVEKGKTQVTNRWSFGGLVGKEYGEALSKLLGRPFSVTGGENANADPYTTISWW